MALPQTVELPKNCVLTVTAGLLDSGIVRRLPPSGSATVYAGSDISASTTTTIGPYTSTRNYELTSLSGCLTYSIADCDDAEDDTTLTGTTNVEEFYGFASSLTTIPSGQTKSVASGAQSIAYGTVTVTGQLSVAGELHVGPWPF